MLFEIFLVFGFASVIDSTYMFMYLTNVIFVFKFTIKILYINLKNLKNLQARLSIGS